MMSLCQLERRSRAKGRREIKLKYLWMGNSSPSGSGRTHLARSGLFLSISFERGKPSRHSLISDPDDSGERARTVDRERS